jgi:hypothetical protein
VLGDDGLLLSLALRGTVGSTVGFWSAEALLASSVDFSLSIFG